MIDTRIRDILRRKGEDVYSVGPLSTVIDAVNTMNDHHVGSVLVCEAGYPVGIFFRTRCFGPRRCDAARSRVRRSCAM